MLLFPFPKQHHKERYHRTLLHFHSECLVGFLEEKPNRDWKLPNLQLPQWLYTLAGPHSTFDNLFKKFNCIFLLAYMVSGSIHPMWVKAQVLFLPEGICFSSDFRLLGCPVTSVLWWVQKKLLICSSSSFFLVLRVEAELFPSMSLSRNPKSLHYNKLLRIAPLGRYTAKVPQLILAWGPKIPPTWS